MDKNIISDVLADFSYAECSAMALGGEISDYGYAFGLLDELDTPLSRLTSLAGRVPPAAVLDRLSAAWVYHALSKQPAIHTICSFAGARFKQENYRDVLISHRQVSEREHLLIHDMRVTTVRRTIIDLALMATAPKPQIQSPVDLPLAVIALAELQESSLEEIAAEVKVNLKNTNLQRAKNYLRMLAHYRLSDTLKERLQTGTLYLPERSYYPF